MSKLERYLASQCITHMGEPDERKHYEKFFNYCALMREMESPKHDVQLHDVMVDFYKYRFGSTHK